jgi:phosphoribosylglycinamide formyltransferase-1
VCSSDLGIATRVVDHRQFPSREAFDQALAEVLDGYSPDLVVLAGFMRILTEGFVRHYEGRLMNIHPSLLPSFPGLHTHQRALDEGVRIHGCTVHFVTPTLDHGPVIIQAAVPVLDSDDEAALSARVLRQEHLVYPQAVRWFAEGKLTLADGRVRVAAELADATAFISPVLR